MVKFHFIVFYTGECIDLKVFEKNHWRIEDRYQCRCLSPFIRLNSLETYLANDRALTGDIFRSTHIKGGESILKWQQNKNNNPHIQESTTKFSNLPFICYLSLSPSLHFERYFVGHRWVASTEMFLSCLFIFYTKSWMCLLNVS